MVTGEQVFKLSMALIDSMTTIGTLDTSQTKDYRGKAPSLLTIIQTEILQLENSTATDATVTDLSLPLLMSDRAANMVAPYGLAANFMLAEMNEQMFDYFNSKYETLKKKLRQSATAQPITSLYEGW